MTVFTRLQNDIFGEQLRRPPLTAARRKAKNERRGGQKPAKLTQDVSGGGKVDWTVNLLQMAFLDSLNSKTATTVAKSENDDGAMEDGELSDDSTVNAPKETTTVVKSEEDVMAQFTDEAVAQLPTVMMKTAVADE